MTLSAGFFSLSCQCKKEKADTKQEHNGLSHMTSDPTIANVGGDYMITGRVEGPSAELGGARAPPTGAEDKKPFVACLFFCLLI